MSSHTGYLARADGAREWRLYVDFGRYVRVGYLQGAASLQCSPAAAASKRRPDDRAWSYACTSYQVVKTRVRLYAVGHTALYFRMPSCTGCFPWLFRPRTSRRPQGLPEDVTQITYNEVPARGTPQLGGRQLHETACEPIACQLRAFRRCRWSGNLSYSSWAACPPPFLACQIFAGAVSSGSPFDPRQTLRGRLMSLALAPCGIGRRILSEAVRPTLMTVPLPRATHASYQAWAGVGSPPLPALVVLMCLVSDSA